VSTRTQRLATNKDGAHDFYAVVDGGTVDVDLWLVGGGSIAGVERQDRETKVSIYLEIQNSRHDLSARVVSKSNSARDLNIFVSIGRCLYRHHLI
jgi:hypothetical protein